MADEHWIVNENFKWCKNPADTSTANGNSYSQPSSDRWLLRGKRYLQDSVKFPSAPATFDLVGVNVFRTQEPLYHAAQRVLSLKKWLSEHEGEFFVISWVLPGPPFHSVVQLFRRSLPEGEDPVFDSLYNKFKNGGDEFQRDRLKFLCLIAEAPWALKVAVSSLGGERPVILCRKLDSWHFKGSNYTEVDVSVASSKIATMLNSVVVRAGASVLLDMGFTIEGQEEDELPERVMASLRWHYCAIDAIACVLGADGNVRSMQVSRPYLSYLDGGNSDVAVDGVDSDTTDRGASGQ